MIKILLGILLCSFLACEAFGEISFSLATNDKLNQLCEKIDNSYKCAQKIEQWSILHGQKGVKRSGRTLAIPLTDHPPLLLRNTKCDDSFACYAYSYIEFLPAINYHLIHIQYYEGHAFLLISGETGKKTKIPATPHISPDAARFISIDSDYVYSFPGIFIYKMTPDGPELEYNYKPEEVMHTFTLVRWINSETIKLREYSSKHKKHCTGLNYAESATIPILLKKINNRWVFRDIVTPASKVVNQSDIDGTNSLKGTDEDMIVCER